MKNLKSHFWYTKNQRNGILLLLILIISLQLVFYFIDFKNEVIVDLNSKQVLKFQKKIDSLKLVEVEKRKPKVYPFNPNFISDHKGYQLGMNTDEIDRLHQFRAKKQFVNSAKEFQRITKISDSLLEQIAPNFKFPDWVKRKRNNHKINLKRKRYYEQSDVSCEISTRDINYATARDFSSTQGVSDALAERIISYRDKLQGFNFDDQIYEVWGIDKNTGKEILRVFSIQKSPEIKRININTATFKEVLALPYIDYDLCVKIFQFRDEVAELQSISELKNIEGFPLEKYDRIILYLLAK